MYCSEWKNGTKNWNDRQLLVTMPEPIQAELGIRNKEFGLFSSVFLWTYGLCSPLAGYLADRVGKRPAGLPRWFEQLDTDGDGQIGLYEWRQAGLPTNHFRDLDLDGDGLLTAAEYLRYVKLHPEGVPVELKPDGKVKR